MHAFLALVRKDLSLHVQDRRALLMNLLAPVLIAAFFGYLFGGGGSAGKPSRVPVAVVNLDTGSALTARIVEQLAADPALDVQRLDAATATARVREGKLRAAVQFPAGFGEQAARALFAPGAKPELQLTHDPSQSMVLPMLRGLVTQQVMQAVSQQAFSADSPSMAGARAMAARSADPTQRAELAQMFEAIERVQARQQAEVAEGAPAASAPMAGGLSVPFEMRLVEATAPRSGPSGYNGFAHSFAGMGVQFVLMLGVEWGVALLVMRRTDLWKRLRVAPLARSVLLGSRLASGALIAFGQFAAILAIGMAVFGVRVLASGLGLVLILLAFALLTASFGLMVAALGRTPEATRGLAIVATLLMVMLGGAWVPSFIFPEWLQQFTLFIPTRWAVDGLDAMTWRGLGLDAALPATGVLLGFALLFGLVALWRFRWEE